MSFNNNRYISSDVYTVASNEGFQPTKFVSSRSNRATAHIQSINDYMDDIDNTTIIGGEISSKLSYDTYGNKTKSVIIDQINSSTSSSTSGIVEGLLPLDLLITVNKSIGMTLLATMGWKEGQGVGERNINSSVYISADGSEIRTSDNKVISIDPSLLSKTLFHKQQDTNNILSYTPSNSNIKVPIPKPKDNVHGVGYSVDMDYPEIRNIGRNRIDVDDSYTSTYHVSSIIDSKNSKSSKKADSGALNSLRYSKATIAYDDECDNVYDDCSYKNIASLTDKKNVLEEIVDSESDDGMSSSSNGVHGGSKHKTPTSTSNGLSSSFNTATMMCPTDGRMVLPNFKLSTHIEQEPYIYPLIQPPIDYKPYHTFKEDAVKVAASNTSSSSSSSRNMNASTRGSILGEHQMLSVSSMKPLIASSQLQAMSQALSSRFVTSDSTSTAPAATTTTVAATAVKPIVRKQACRVTTAWTPVALLCKRLNVPISDTVKASLESISKSSSVSREQELFDKNISSFIQPITDKVTNAVAVNYDSDGDDADSSKDKVKPSIDVFKSIFETIDDVDTATATAGSDNSSRAAVTTSSSHAVNAAVIGCNKVAFIPRNKNAASTAIATATTDSITRSVPVVNDTPTLPLKRQIGAVDNDMRECATATTSSSKKAKHEEDRQGKHKHKHKHKHKDKHKHKHKHKHSKKKKKSKHDSSDSSSNSSSSDSY